MEALALFHPPQGQADDLPLSTNLQYQLWCRIAQRLEAGDSLVTQARFQRAMETDYHTISGNSPTAAVKSQLRSAIAALNNKHPETYLSSGARNAISKAFRQGIDTLQWNLTTVQAKGAPVIRRFLKGEMRSFFADQGLDAQAINPLACVQPIVRHLAEQAAIIASSPAAAQNALPLAEPPSTLWDEIEIPQDPPHPQEQTESVHATIEEAIRMGQIDEDVRERMNLQERWHTEFQKEEKTRIPQHLDAFVQRGLLTNLEAHNLRKIIDGQQGRRHNSTVVRAKLQEKLQPALAETVFCLEVFAALKRIPAARDAVLKFLIRHRERVTTPDHSAGLRPLIEHLRQDPDLLANTVEIAECKDQEIHLIALHLPPYSRILKEPLEQLEIDEHFVDHLRTRSNKELSNILSDPNPAIRQKPLIGARALITLIGQLIELTPFCQEVRILHISQSLDSMYATANNRKKGREKIEHYLKHQIDSLYPDLTPHERTAVEQFAAEFLQHKKAQQGRKRQEEEASLSAKEIELGVRFARVEVRLAGQNKRVPYKVMEDPDFSGVFIVVRTDPKTGDVVPALRHGEKRYVERNRDGFWKMGS